MTVQSPEVSQVELNTYITCWLDTDLKPNELQKKLKHLANLVLNLARISTKQTNLTIFTNNRVDEFEPLLRPLTYKENSIIEVREVSREELIDIPTKLYIPWLLTWIHKKKMKNDIEHGHENSIYLYLEDDAIFTSDNLNYFLEYLTKLSQIGLIPGFLRAEWSKTASSWLNPDTFSDASSSKLAILENETEVFFQRENPYSASILLNQELAEEYLQSESFNQQTAWNKHKFIFDIGSTAALGLIAENVPNGFLNRVATPHNPKNFYPHPGCILRHQGDKYANDIWQSHFELFGTYPEKRLITRRSIFDKLIRLGKKDRLFIIKKLLKEVK